MIRISKILNIVSGFLAAPNHLMKSFVANAALECLLTRMGQPVVLIVAFLMKSFATILAHPRFVSHMYPHVCIQGRTPIEGFATRTTFVRFL